MAVVDRPLGGAAAATGTPPGGAGVSDVQLEILEMNSYAMHLCQERGFEEALECLETAYLRLQTLSDNIHSAPPSEAAAGLPLVDKLKAATLNNLGVVESHRGNYDRAAEHLEAARNLELHAGVQSPSTALNLCAVCNSAGAYERAAQLAEEAIETLNQTVLQQQPQQQQQQAGAPTAAEETKALWGAAWHNLAIAELNCNRPSRTVDVLATFRNAMTATKDLLGPKHPMTVAVHESFRLVRDTLKREGAFRQRQPTTSVSGVAALPRLREAVTPATAHQQRVAQSARSHEGLSTAHLVLGTNNHGNGAFVDVPKPSRFVAMRPYTMAPDSAATSGSLTSRPRGRRAAPSNSLYRPTLASRGGRRVYTAQHPLIQQQKQQQGLLPAIPAAQQQHRSGTADTPRRIAPRPPGSPQSVKAGGGLAGTGSGDVSGSPLAYPGPPVGEAASRGGPRPPNGNRGGPPPPPAAAGGGRRPSDVLLGDMWVELQVPTRVAANPPPPTVGATASGSGGGMEGNTGQMSAAAAAALAHSQQPQHQHQQAVHTGPVRPTYGEALYVIDPSDVALEPISDPGAHATLDRQSNDPPATGE